MLAHFDIHVDARILCEKCGIVNHAWRARLYISPGNEATKTYCFPNSAHACMEKCTPTNLDKVASSTFETSCSC